MDFLWKADIKACFLSGNRYLVTTGFSKQDWTQDFILVIIVFLTFW